MHGEAGLSLSRVRIRAHQEFSMTAKAGTAKAGKARVAPKSIFDDVYDDAQWGRGRNFAPRPAAKAPEGGDVWKLTLGKARDNPRKVK